MAFITCLTACLLYSLSEIFDKIGSCDDDEHTELKLLVWFGIVNLCITCFYISFNLGETGLAPWTMIFQSPVLVFPSLFYVLALLTAFISLKFIPVSIETPLCNVNSLFAFVGVVLMFLATGNTQELRNELTTTNIIALVFVLTGILTLMIHGLKVGKSEIVKRNVVVFGSAFAILSAFFDALDTIFEAYILGDASDSNDFVIVYGFTIAVIAFIAYIYLCIITKKIYNPFAKSELFRMLAGVVDALGNVAYVYAVELVPVLVSPITSSYIILTLIIARLFLKEKLSRTQYLSILTVIIGISFFALIP